MPSNDLSDESILPELFFLIANFLKNSPYHDCAKQLIDQLEKNNVFSKRVDWTGREHHRSFNELVSLNPAISSNLLLKLCNQLRLLFDQSQRDFSKMNTLLGTGQYSALQDVNTLGFKRNEFKYSNMNALPKNIYSNYATNDNVNVCSGGFSNSYNYSKRSLNGSTNMLLNINKRQIDGRLDTLNIIQPDTFKSINMHKRIFGHLASIYCVLFDRTGRYIFTGADDNLIKAWCSTDGRLMATFRGHDKEISDLDINFENTLLASGSCDKTIRIWNLKTTETVCILSSHNSMITSVEFCPQCKEDTRWLASSGGDGAVCLWRWNARTLEFQSKPFKFIEKSRAGTQILCISFSAGGLFLATGSSDNMIRIYSLFENQSGPSKIFELETHKNLVDSIQYSNHSLRFVSGSKDGSALIWKYESRKWNVIRIDATKTLNNYKSNENEISLSDITKKNNVSMVTWNCDDSLVITAQGNFVVKVWNSSTGQLIHELKGHEADVFVLEAHPRDPRLVLSAGNEGFLFLWNVLTGKLIKKFINKSANEDPGWIFDTKWSPNMDMFASTDSSGHLVVFGFGSDENYQKTPIEQFFHTDYRPLMRDQSDYVLDEQTQQPPHLMPPPYLVDADGNPYSAEYQRLVPGRDQASDAQLNPQVIINDRGMPEIIIDNDHENNQASASSGAANSRRRHLWVKDFIRPLDQVKLKTCESNRLAKLDEEENYYYSQTVTNNKEAKFIQITRNSSKTNLNSDESRRRSNRSSRRRNANDSDGYIDRLNFKALYDTDNEKETPARTTNGIHSDYDEDTKDNYIDVDDDSNTNLSASNNNMANTSGLMISIQNDEATNMSSTNIQTSRNQTSVRVSLNNNSSRNNAALDLDLIDQTESDSSEYSDWAQQEGRNTFKPPPRRTRKKKRLRQSRRTLKVQDDEDDNEALNESNESKLVRPSRSKRAKIVSDDEEKAAQTDSQDENEGASNDENDETSSNQSSESSDEEYDDDIDPNKPCTSHSANSRKGLKRSKKSKSSRKNKINNLKRSKSTNDNLYQKSSKSAAITAASARLISNVKQKSKSKPAKLINECPVEYRPPEWLTSTKPKKSPYVPQIGDEVVYFRQGHELYVQAVKSTKIYQLDESTLPWNKNKNIGVQEFCKVIAIKFEIKPPRLVCLKLAIIDSDTKAVTNSNFSIKYHDMNHVVDFVILRQFYDRGVSRNWRAKDKFRCIIDDAWWFGHVESRKPFQDEYPESQFQCLKILWECGGAQEDLSPWDLEPISGVNARKTKPVSSTSIANSNESIAVTNEELKSLLYEPVDGDWPEEDRDAECERILEGLRIIMELSIAEAFNFPVDLDSFPDYAILINYPIDLSTIKERIENRYYRRLNSIQFDIRYIETNAIKFNQPNSLIVKHATLLTELLLEFVADHHCTNPIPIYKRLCESKRINSLDLNQSGSHPNQTHNNKKNSNNISSNNNNNSMKTNNINTVTSKTYAKRKTYTIDGWISQCQKLINELINHEDSIPFRQPVDLVEYPDYISVVDTPIDLGTINDKLNNGFYETLSDFDIDCRLLFQNSRAYNTNKRSPIYAITLKLKNFYESRIEEIFQSHKAALKQKNLMTSRYGRKIKARTETNLFELNATAILDENPNTSSSIGHHNNHHYHGLNKRTTRNSNATLETNNYIPSNVNSKLVMPKSSHNNNNNYHNQKRCDDTDEDIDDLKNESYETNMLERSFLNDFENENANHPICSKQLNQESDMPNSLSNNKNKHEASKANESENSKSQFNFNFNELKSSKQSQEADVNKSSSNQDQSSFNMSTNEVITLNSLLQQTKKSNSATRYDSDSRHSNEAQCSASNLNGLRQSSRRSALSNSTSSNKLNNGHSTTNDQSTKGVIKRKRKGNAVKGKKKKRYCKKKSNIYDGSDDFDEEDDDDEESEDNDDEDDEDYVNSGEDEDQYYAAKQTKAAKHLENSDLYDKEDAEELVSRTKKSNKLNGNKVKSKYIESDDEEKEEDENDDDDDDEYIEHDTKSSRNKSSKQINNNINNCNNNNSYNSNNNMESMPIKKPKGRPRKLKNLDNKENNASVSESDLNSSIEPTSVATTSNTTTTTTVTTAASTATTRNSLRGSSNLKQNHSSALLSSRSFSLSNTRSSKRSSTKQVSYRESSSSGNSSEEEYPV